MNRPSAQTGMTLIVSLIMLTLMTVMAIGSFNIGRVSMDIVGNMQHRSEVIAAADGAIQAAVSTTNLMIQSDDVFGTNSCDGTPNKYCADTNGDDTIDVEVFLRGPPDNTGVLAATPECVMAQPIPNAALNLTTAGTSQVECALQVDQASFGISGGVTGNSLCANSMWEIHAVANDLITEATVTVTEGVAVVASTANIATRCP